MARTKGALNKSTGVREHFVKAWEKQGGDALAARLLKAALDRFVGYDSVERTYEYPTDEKTKKRSKVLVKEKVTREFDSSGLALLLPYFAQQMPRLQELTGKDGAPLVPPAPVLPPLDLSKLSDEKLDLFIAATAAAHAAHTAKHQASPAPATETAPAVVPCEYCKYPAGTHGPNCKAVPPAAP